jgi:hypothetical protein
MGSGYRDWAQSKIDNIKNILESSRAEHTQAVKQRIDSVQKMKDVVSVTEGLFALSKETAQLEADAFVQRQKVALATEVKAVLDSWVRFEQQQKEEEQANLTKTVIENVLKSIKDEKTQKDILLGAIAEVERESSLRFIYLGTDGYTRSPFALVALSVAILVLQSSSRTRSYNLVSHSSYLRAIHIRWAFFSAVLMASKLGGDRLTSCVAPRAGATRPE